ncbi:unnamed protein product [Caenorhabditis auriculariae]|uniref:BUD13 homolog n=1 Tax=Caenorhabditis auriculariae TaxID=2777116 RepID=A0A8S1H2Q0_9PELO|nr:unnamed protein product [Caenorhabditis auriculariae]
MREFRSAGEAMSLRAEYLKKYLSGGAENDEKKKKKKKKTMFKPAGMKIVEDDRFLSVEAAKIKEYGSDEEREELEVIKQIVTKAKVVPGFKKTFAEVEDVVKQEPSSPDRPSSKEKSSVVTKRRQRHDSSGSEDNSPVRRKRHDSSDSDQSPPRVETILTTHLKDLQEKRHDSDNSPPRPARRRHDSDNSPPRPSRKRHDFDNSPPRPPRKRHDSDSSPPRRSRQERSPSPKRLKKEADLSPPRRYRRNSDSSPPRKNRRQSPQTSRRPSSPKRIKRESDDERENSKQKTLDGKVAGLQSARALKEESDRLRAREAKMFDELDANVSGRDAETVHRKKQIQRGKDTPEERARKEREAKKTEELKEKYKDWNKGVAQVKDRAERLEEMARVAAEPVARRNDDEEMNRYLKEQLHEADPMAAMLRKRKRESAIDRGEDVYPMYTGHWDPNRFMISPGYRWDGVDRSNGFEGKLARTKNQKAANQQEYYKAIATLD